jgi:DNA polymerase I-like protein with 3'-5' exonuclease and polymerase domains
MGCAGWLQNRVCETLLGRRRYFPALKMLTDRNQRGREEREAINAPIQGTAADIMKIAMIRVPAALVNAHLSARMTLQVHDELVLECPVENWPGCRISTTGNGGCLYSHALQTEGAISGGVRWTPLPARADR